VIVDADRTSLIIKQTAQLPRAQWQVGGDQEYSAFADFSAN